MGAVSVACESGGGLWRVLDEVEQELADGAVLVLVRGWYWLLDNEGHICKVNCNSAKALIAQGNLDEWKAQA